MFKQQDGISLTELMVSMAIITVAYIAFYSIFSLGSRILTANTKSNVNNEEASLVIRELSRELKEANGPKNLKNIEAANSNQISFYSDYNNDGTIELVSYFLSSNTLFKGVIVPSPSDSLNYSAAENIKQVAKNIKNNTSPFFRYYNSNRTELNNFPLNSTDRGNVVFVRISVKIDDDPEKLPKQINLDTEVSLRNSK